VGLPNEALNDRGHVVRPRFDEFGGFISGHAVLPLGWLPIRHADQLEDLLAPIAA
jgi:hypothetical protein